jgi:hypothetical protein
MDAEPAAIRTTINREYGTMSANESKSRSSALIVGAIGVVFGDIGTSPLYALKETFAGHHPITVEPESILGVLVADLLDHHGAGDLEIRRHHHARRQSRRRRQFGPARPVTDVDQELARHCGS